MTYPVSLSAWGRRLGGGLALFAAFASALAMPARRPEPVATPAADAYLWGSDISALGVFEAHGALYRDRNGVPGDAVGLLRRAGQNTFRLRLFVNPIPDGIVTNDLEYTLVLARRVVASGAKLFVDLHYSDTWADPAHQTKPAAWNDLSFEQLEQRVELYTAEVLNRFVQEGLRPDLVQLGNEITNGMLWPDAKIEFARAPDTEAWARFARLQAAAWRGFTTAFPGADRPQVVLHIESTGNLPRTHWYLQTAQALGVRFDIVGLSYYPEWHGSLTDLAATLALAAEVAQRPVLIAEVAYPFKDDEHWQDVKNLTFPRSPAGQQAFMNTVHELVRAVPHGRGLGAIWWHPESIPNPDIRVWLGGSCALFDHEGRLLPAATAGRLSPSPTPSTRHP